MASGDTRTNQYLDIAANGTRSDLPAETCCETRTQTLIRGVAERIMDVEDEVEEIKNNPDVADVVATYADLEAYDTSKLTDKDIIRVLEDEEHDGASTYYRYSTASQEFTYIGEVGPYYTEDEVDNLLAGKQDTLTFDTTPTADSTNPVTSGGIKTYVDTKSVTFKPYPSSVNTTGTTAQFIASIQALNADPGIAYLGTVELSDMPASLIQEEVQVYVYDNNLIYCVMYSADTAPYAWWCNSYDYRGWEPMYGAGSTYTAGANIQISNNNVISATDTTYSAGNGLSLNGTTFSADTTVLATQTDLASKQDTLTAGANVTISGNTISATDTTYSNFTGTDGTSAGAAGLVPAPATTDAGKFLKADGTWDTAGGGSGVTVVQTAGTSTTDVMSQNAVTSIVEAQKLKLGGSAVASGNRTTALGYYANATSNDSIAIGANAYVAPGAVGAIALGESAVASTGGELNIGTAHSNGYNSSAYRLISGVYDGQSDHDAATKGQLDSIAIKNAGAPTTATVGTVGQLLEDTTNGKLYICTAADTVTPSYTWEEVGTGGGGSGVIELTSADLDYPDNTPTGVALWRLDPGVYFIGSDAFVGVANTSGEASSFINQSIVVVAKYSSTSTSIVTFDIQAGASWMFRTVTATGAKGTAVSISPNIVQATGTSTTNVMSQNAVTSMVFADPSTKQKVKIGSGSSVGFNSDYAIAIGRDAQCSVATPYSIALGAGAVATMRGQMDISTGSNANGYNSTIYRLLTGLYDPQSAHDAATKGYVDTAISGISVGTISNNTLYL